MFPTNTLALLPLAAVALSALSAQPVSARIGGNAVQHAARHAKNAHVPVVNEIRRADNESSKRSTSDKTKRKVKKRKNSCVARPSNATTLAATSTRSSSAASSSSATWNNEWGVNTDASSTHSSSTHASATSSSAPATSSAATSYNSEWQLTETWSGNSFFDHWSFWSWDDPTHGTVKYVDAGTAWNEGLISINNKGNAIMKVDTTEHVSGGRKSVRIHGNLVYTGGLVLMDAVHMPVGCGTWPAWWSNGPNWPYGGEIDILEGVNAFSQNQISLHTGSGCKMVASEMEMQGGLTTGNFDAYNCASYETSNQGCGVRDAYHSDGYGTGYNNVGGGVYAMKWDKEGIKIWWFNRNSIPADITAEQPIPSSWGTPVADFPSTDCDPYKFFYEHFNIFDTTFCGDWAGADGVWNYAGYAGQDQSCAAITGYSTCADYVLNKGSAFNDAYWEVAYVKYFNSTTAV
ncbi:hypothetical protein QFC22_003848 [Naganishia vaughanmartiniae]|uniref:Uncharacterized protein n=1 Tax=Naganishia vaughanmartiniae TaxID=1424756 RepID=A0ACC2X3P4_9TREE|nr:hypothetical protein QFC22_003848 [Naganishia vaughanmartiniae]